ncbi:MAG TPA: shikimate dehydrogenase, partial [Candidatus Dormibacteraeota bacterium]
MLLGQGIAYSASPALQNAALAARGLDDWRYELCDVAPEGLRAAVERLRGPEYAGANVTIPHKVAVLELLDEVDPEARAVGALNTIVSSAGRLVGHNTDVVAIRGALGRLGARMALRVIVLGAGGSA